MKTVLRAGNSLFYESTTVFLWIIRRYCTQYELWKLNMKLCLWLWEICYHLN